MSHPSPSSPSRLRTGLAAGLLVAGCGFASAQTTTLLSDSFATGTPLSGWYWTGGSFEATPSFGQAYNQVSSSYQIFTRSFATTDLAAGDTLRLTFDYNPNSTNITRVWASLFGGTAATASGWNQYGSSTGVSDTWSGYSGGIATSAAPHRFLRAEGGAGGDWHPYATWDATPLFNNVAGVDSSLGTGAVRTARLEVQNTGTSVTMTLFEGASEGVLSVVHSAIDSTAGRKTTGYNIVAFEFDVTSGNGDMRYDNVLVQHIAAVPEPSSVALLAGAGTLGLAAIRRRRRA